MKGREHPLTGYLEEAGKDKTREADQLLLHGKKEEKIFYKGQAGTKMMNWQQNDSMKDDTSWKQRTLLHWFMIQLRKIYTPKGTERERYLLGGKWRKSEDTRTWQWKCSLTRRYKLNNFCFLVQQRNCMAWKISTPAEDRAVWSCKERFQLTEISEKKGLPNPQTVQTLSVGNI